MKPILYALMLTIPLLLAPAQAASTSLSVTMDAATYSASGLALAGNAPIATVKHLDAEGQPIAGASVQLIVLRQVQFVGFVSNETFTGTTGSDGTFTQALGKASSLPGTYLVVARAGNLTTQTRYAVTA